MCSVYVSEQNTVNVLVEQKMALWDYGVSITWDSNMWELEELKISLCLFALSSLVSLSLFWSFIHMISLPGWLLTEKGLLLF